MLQELLNAIDVQYEKLRPFLNHYTESANVIEGILICAEYRHEMTFSYTRGASDITINGRTEKLDFIKNFIRAYRVYEEERYVLASAFDDRYERILKDDISGWVRSGVVHNENCSEETMRYLASDTDMHVRCALASKLNCPHDVLNKLSLLNNVKAEAQVRINVAKSKNCPIDILRRLVTDKNSSVRLAILHREDCPEDIIHILSMDANEDIRKEAKRRLKDLK